MTEETERAPRKRAPRRKRAAPAIEPVQQSVTGLTAEVTAGSVLLSWPEGAGWTEVARDGKTLAVTPVASYRDHRVKPGTRYRYAVREIQGKMRRGDWLSLIVDTPGA